MTRQSWRLIGDEEGGRLEGLEGGTRSGPDAATLVRSATGWEIPVDALSAWARGARAPEHGPAQVEYGADGELATLRQDGWTLRYSDWRPSAGFDVALPYRLEATCDDARVRLVVDAWTAPDSP